MARFRIVALLAAAALALAACGDSGNDDGGGDGDGDGPSEIEVVATDFAFSPDAYTVPPGGDVSVRLDNEGTLEHNWVLLAEPIRSEEELTEGNVLFEATAQAGESVTTSFTAPAPGDYQVICDIPGHFAAGMEAELTVTG